MTIELNSISVAYKRVLIVDDEEIIGSLMERIFKMLAPATNVVCASNGFAALEQFEQQRFDLMVTDYEMPGMNGLELARTVHHISPETRIILMSGGILPLNEVVASLGLDGYLAKPFSPAQILDVINLL